jgi:hypothetical protein
MSCKNILPEKGGLIKPLFRHCVQFRSPLSPDGPAEKMPEQLLESVENLVGLLASAGGLRKAVLGEAA